MIDQLQSIQNDLWLKMCAFDDIASAAYLRQDHPTWKQNSAISMEYFRAWSRIDRLRQQMIRQSIEAIKP